MAHEPIASSKPVPPERRKAPRRRLRDRIASLETANPSLHRRYELKNLMLLVEDDLRQTALALGAVDGYVGRAMELLQADAIDVAALSAHTDDEAVLEQLDTLADNLANLRRRMGMIAASIK